MAAVLIYHMEDARRQILEGLCRSMNITPVRVDEDAHRAPIGLLSGSVSLSALRGGMPGRGGSESGSSCAPVREEMIVMCGFSKPQFDAFLEMLRMAGLKIGLKAVETPTNRMWNGEMLQNELARERETFMLRQASRNRPE